MQQLRTQKQKHRPRRRFDPHEVFAVDPRDSDVTRVEAQMRAATKTEPILRREALSGRSVGLTRTGVGQGETEMLAYELQQERKGRWVTIGFRPVHTKRIRIVAEWRGYGRRHRLIDRS